MFLIPLLLRISPTLVDPRAAIPMGLLNSVYISGQFFRKMLSNSSGNEGFKVTQIFKKYGSLFVVNLVIIIVILSVMDYFTPEIVTLLEDPNVPFFMDPSVFVLIITILLLAYPIFSLVGRLEKVITAVSDSITINLGSKSTEKPVHRIIRNMLFIGLVLLLVAVFITFITEIEEIPKHASHNINNRAVCIGSTDTGYNPYSAKNNAF